MAYFLSKFDTARFDESYFDYFTDTSTEVERIMSVEVVEPVIVKTEEIKPEISET